jgi:hypothetical protein
LNVGMDAQVLCIGWVGWGVFISPTTQFANGNKLQLLHFLRVQQTAYNIGTVHCRTSIRLLFLVTVLTKDCLVSGIGPCHVSQPLDPKADR